ncbi:hypothetical protein BCU88_19340 [Vibrio splendidus]|jgi:hypothetical protein|uniref:hypothetical protein n=1 Tax=Vibrio splendidus TaxID=29497 RepID=UPI000C84ABCB|nr:hypothetical protein [Vibrio splendidus]PMG54793.1 hypothetical protein BCU88_19340 [Vibrio splendidus]
MKCNVCLVKDSIEFGTVEEVTESFAKASALIGKMTTDFVHFSKSNDFDDFVGYSIATQGYDETGHLYVAAFDGNLSSTNVLELNSTEVISIAENNPPELEGRWIALYSDSASRKIAQRSKELTCEHSLTLFCSDIVRQNKRHHKDYAIAFKDIYQNLIFRTDDKEEELLFNRMSKIDGGYDNYILTMMDCLGYMNSYEIIPDDSLKNIEQINGGLGVSVTPEGKGKGKRPTNELKRDFYINSIKYENVNCEYHCKLQYPDGAPSNGKPKSNRIYFGFITAKNSGPKIAIAHIGEHW